jgi:hypothetical protein
MMFLAGAKTVIIPSNENFLNQKDFDPMQGVYLTEMQQADLVENHLDFIPNRTVLTAAPYKPPIRSTRRRISQSSRRVSGCGM